MKWQRQLAEARAEVEKCAVTAEYYALKMQNLFCRMKKLDAGYTKNFVDFNDRGRTGNHALEFSFMAGVQICRPQP